MTPLVDAMLPTLLPALLALGGGALLARGLWRHGADLRRPLGDPRLPIALMRCGRAVLVGLAAIGVAVGWHCGLDTLVAIALTIGLEELLEFSVVISAVESGPPKAWRTGPG